MHMALVSLAIGPVQHFITFLIHVIYTGPSISGYSQQRPHSLVWSQIFPLPLSVSFYFSPSSNTISLVWPQFLGK